MYSGLVNLTKLCADVIELNFATFLLVLFSIEQVGINRSFLNYKIPKYTYYNDDRIEVIYILLLYLNINSFYSLIIRE